MGSGGDPFRGLCYASVQEHATKTSWQQLGKIAGQAGATLLRRICGHIAADEARHERVYRGMMRGIVECDPEGALEAMRDTLGRIAMPAKNMSDGRSRTLFRDFAAIGQRIGVYGLRDYADNVEGFVSELGLDRLGDLSGDGPRHQDEVCRLPGRYREQADRLDRHRVPPRRFRWIHDRLV
jgi:acyl-[acyl-carrier-protein] desaturase